MAQHQPDQQNYVIPNHNNNNNNTSQHNANDTSNLWVFGYGSLCWHPGFEFVKCVTGYVRGYSRRFWQGNITHRGTKQNPGRVATLVEDKEGITWGCAYKIIGNAALEYLKERECTLGGYKTDFIKFYPRIGKEGTEISGEAFPALIYIATEENDIWMGDKCLLRMACDIVDCSGASGHNVEYVLRLAIFMREELPDVEDEHLFTLERYIHEILDRRAIPVEHLMGPPPQRIRRDSHADIGRPSSFEHTSRVPDKKLRCLHI